MNKREEESAGVVVEEIRSLAEAVCNSTLTAAQYERLNALLATDEEAARVYATYLRMHGLLLWHCRNADISPVSSPALPLVETSPFMPLQTPFFANAVSTGGYLFSYSLAVFIVGIGLLIGWACHVPIGSEVAVKRQQPAPTIPAPKQEPTFVGQVTGIFDLKGSAPETGVAGYTRVVLGQKYALPNGLVEITYDTGARVILQGPCVYQVDSRSGGYLSAGKLTARVTKKSEIGIRNSEKRTSKESDFRLPNSELFAIRTPTALITDLGTEFGVEVDKSGMSRAYVYEGRVKLQATAGETPKPVLLETDQSARVSLGKDGRVAVVRQTGQESKLVRQMPRSAPITLFNSGVGLKEAEPDPHWQVIARSDDPKFKPQAALVRGPGGNALENDPTRSQWLSLVAGEAEVPEDVVYVFRTTFNLNGLLPSTAVLRGKFIADDRVNAIRLNGRKLKVPLQPDGGPFIHWTQFHATTGFVKGVNVLDFEVLNADPLKSPPERRTAHSRMSCRVELEGEATRDPGLDGNDLSGKSLSPTGGNNARQKDDNPKSEKELKGPENEKSNRGSDHAGNRFFPFIILRITS
jgi:hypothetical protein